LENTRNQALSNLQAEQQKNAATFNQQRNTANAQNRLSAKNFQEYLASTGRANSGLNAQARMQNANNLNTTLGSINSGESAALADINRRTTDANNAYNSGLASANAQIEADYIKNLLDQREKDLNRQLQERQFNESVRQFNENLALQKQQLYSRFSGGSGGGRRSYRGYSGGSSNNDIDLGGSAPTGKDAVKVGQLYAVDTGKKTVWYRKTANGKDPVVGSPFAPIQNKSTKKAAKKTATKKKTTKKVTNQIGQKKGMLSYTSR
jgi:hypothetical protein